MNVVGLPNLAFYPGAAADYFSSQPHSEFKLHGTYPGTWESHTLGIQLTQTQIRLGDV